MNRSLSLGIITFGIAAGVVISAQQAEAVAYFARQFKTECRTCHTIFPERNEFGDAFYKNAFQWPSGAKTPLSAAAEGLQAQPNDGLLLNMVPANVPISFLGANSSSFNSNRTDNSGKPSKQFELFNSSTYEIFTAGNFANKAGFFAEYSFSGNSVGEAYIEAHHPFDLPLSVKGGKFKPKLSLWKSSDRNTINGLSYISRTVGNAPEKINDDDGGVEISSIIAKRLFVATGIMNGKNRTSRNGKDWYGHVSARLTGTDFLGNEPDVDLDHDSIFDFLTVTIGGFGYVGSNDLTAKTTSLKIPNYFYRTGAETDISYKVIRLRLASTLGADDNAYNNAITIKSKSLTTQASYYIGSSLVLSGRYEYEQIDGDNKSFTLNTAVDKGVSNGSTIIRRFGPTIAWTPLANVRLAGEFLYKKDTSAALPISRDAYFRVDYSF